MKTAFRKVGLEAVRRKHVRFGTRWEYDVRWMLGREPEVVIDVGGHHGETANRVAGAFPSARVVSLEPSQASFAQLSANTAHLPNVTCRRVAAGESVGTALISTREASSHNALVADGDGEAVDVITIDGLCEELSIDFIDLLKIDTEGFETQVLAGASGMLGAGRVEAVLCECEFTPRGSEPHGNFHEIFEILERDGMRVVAFYSSGVDRQGWRWGDVLFARAAAEPGSVSCSPNV